MIVSFRNPDGTVQRVSAEITKKQSLSPHGQQPLLVTSDGEAVDEKSWVVLNYQVVSATTRERYELKKIGLI
ncbi:MAG: hypothetical protein ACYDAA_18340 [Syntrophales bacterium]